MLNCQRHLFSLPEGLHYLNCGYMSPLSKRVEEAGIVGMRRKRVPSDISPTDFLENLHRVRLLFSRLVNAPDPARIAVIPSASYGLATAAWNIRVGARQNIVLVSHQFPSNVYVWRRLARSEGAELRTVEPPSDEQHRGREWNERLLESIDGDTAVVAIPQVHWTDGTLFDLRTIGERVRETGAAIVLDGTQSVGALPIDVDRFSPDAVVCAAYKWLMGPYSIGVAYYGPRFDEGRPLEETWLARRGSEDFRRLVDYEDAYRVGAARYDVGETSNFVLLPMLVAALEQLTEWGVSEVQAYCRHLTDCLVSEARELGFGIEEEAWRAGHMLGLRMPAGQDPEKISTELTSRGVSVSLRGDVLRVTPHVYNDEADVHALLDAVREVAT
jgi:selenocysteine lyase/cysteine desulfurase